MKRKFTMIFNLNPMKKTIIISLVVALVFFALGYLIKGAKINPTGQSVKGADTFQAGWDAAKTRLAESGLAGGALNMEIRQLYGEIKEINGDKITLKIRPLEPLADVSLDTRTVVVDKTTKIYSLEMKDSKEYLAEMAAYNKKIQPINSTAPFTPIAPPDGFKKSEISLADLKVGQMINVTAENNIKTIKEFTALEISYNQLVAPTPPAVPATASTTRPVK